MRLAVSQFSLDESNKEKHDALVENVPKIVVANREPPNRINKLLALCA